MIFYAFNISIYNKGPIKVDAISSFVTPYRNELKFVPGSNPKFTYTPKNCPKEMKGIYDLLSEFFVNMNQIIDN